MLPLPFPLHAAVQALTWAALSLRLGRAVCERHLRPCEAPAMLRLRDAFRAMVAALSGAGLPPAAGPAGQWDAAAGAAVAPPARGACHVVVQLVLFYVGLVAPLLLGWAFQRSLRRRAATAADADADATAGGATAAAAAAAATLRGGGPGGGGARGGGGDLLRRKLTPLTDRLHPRAAALGAAAVAVASWVAANAAARHL
jgi:formate hydrogenlyase subunit 3/multisubunit Na+/H+ antiporter MnhD subunit